MLFCYLLKTKIVLCTKGGPGRVSLATTGLEEAIVVVSSRARLDKNGLYKSGSEDTSAAPVLDYIVGRIA